MNDSLAFDIMWYDQILVSVSVDQLTKKITLSNGLPNHFMYPFKMPHVTLTHVMSFLESRCFPKSRANCDELLTALGLQTYDVIAITKKTHGLMMDDFLWLRYSGERVTYDDIKIRY